MFPVFKNVREKFRTKKYRLIGLLYVVSGLLVQLQIFWQLHLIELLEKPLDVSKPFDKVWQLALLHKLDLMKFQVGISALFCHLPVIDGFGLFWMGNFCKGISLMPVSLKAPYTLIIFLVIVFVILLSMLIISLTVRIIIGLLIWAFDLWQLLYLASELESDLRDNLD